MISVGGGISGCCGVIFVVDIDIAIVLIRENTEVRVDLLMLDDGTFGWLAFCNHVAGKMLESGESELAMW